MHKSIASARSEGLTLVSNNLRELEHVEALQLANWATDVLML
jgi:tRNA(fMet)-specific endonuclease VapC